MGEGLLKIVNNDVSAKNDAVFVDGIDQPWVKFQWRGETRGIDPIPYKIDLTQFLIHKC